MTRETINPEALYGSVEYGFSHAVKSDGNISIHCSGQVAWDKDHNVVGVGDVGAQARQALANLKIVLETAGAGVGVTGFPHRDRSHSTSIELAWPSELESLKA